MAGLLEGKRLLVTGVLTDTSMAFHVARLAQEQGATVVLSSFGRQMRITEVISRRLPQPAPVVQLDVSSSEDLAALAGRVTEHLGPDAQLDGVVHSIGFAPQSHDGRRRSSPPSGPTWPRRCRSPRSASRRSSWPPARCSHRARASSASPSTPPWPGPCTAGWAWPRPAFESVSRYLARELGKDGVRCNLVAAGPVRTTAAKAIPGFEAFESVWSERAPLAWDVKDPVPPAQACVALLSDWFPKTTGEIVHVDGGVHAVGA